MRPESAESVANKPQFVTRASFLAPGTLCMHTRSHFNHYGLWRSAAAPLAAFGRVRLPCCRHAAALVVPGRAPIVKFPVLLG